MLVLHWDGSKWINYSPEYKSAVLWVEVASHDDVWVFGYDTFHWCGQKWERYDSGDLAFRAMSFSAANDGWASGYILNKLYHWDGFSWTPIESPIEEYIDSISMVSPHEGWASSWNSVLYFKGDRPVNSHILIPLLYR